MDVRVEIEAVTVTMHCDDDAGEGAAGSEATSWNISLSPCQADWQSRPSSRRWYLKMGRRSLGMVKTYWAWLTCSRMCVSSHSAKSRTRFCWHEGQKSLHLHE